MSKFEGASNLNNPELNPSELEDSVNVEKKQGEGKEIIEMLQKECSEPISEITKMPIYSFSKLMEKFETNDLKTITETGEYKEMIKNGFILGSGEERIYYEQKPGRISEKEPTNIHLGVDFMVENGKDVLAINDGEVVDIENIDIKSQPKDQSIYKGEGGYGNMLVLKHKLESGEEIYSLYGHLSSSEKPLKLGDVVKKGQIIGNVGRSFSHENGGWPSHLHFSILKEKIAIAGYGAGKDAEKIIDPLKIWIQEKGVDSGELPLEKLEVRKTERGAEKPELSPEEQLKNLEGEAEMKQQEIARLTESVAGTKVRLNEAREKLGLPPTEEDPPSVFSEKDKLEKLQTEQKTLDKQKEEIISQQEKERMIREEKEKILQEKIDELFKEFEGLTSRDFESIFKNGRTKEGRNVESPSMGELNPEIAKSLAKAFKKGIKLLPKILEILPELLKKFDKDLTKEATERVEEKLEEEKKELKEKEVKEKKPAEQKPEEKREVPGSKIKQELNPIEGGNIKNPKA